MSKPLDWTTVSDDPNNREAKAAVRAWLKTAQRVHTDSDLLGHIENLVRPWAMGRKAWLFAGSELAGQRAAVVMSLLQSAKLHGHDP